MTSKDPATTCESLISRVNTLQMATIGEHGEPHCGYTPFLADGKDFIIFVSQLAVHTRDLLANDKVEVMMIDDEHVSNNLFARCRVRYQCRAVVIKPEDTSYSPVLNAYEERQGKVVKLLRQLPDFVLFRLQPASGVLVLGFGDAYRIEGANMDNFVHISSS